VKLKLNENEFNVIFRSFTPTGMFVELLSYPTGASTSVPIRRHTLHS